MTQAPIEGGYLLLTYDAWGRLVGNGSGPMLTTYVYDGLHRRVRRYRNPTSQFGFDKRVYYDASWRVLEGADYAYSTVDTAEKFVNGLRYVDDVVCRHLDFDNDGVYGDTGAENLNSIAYYCTDANFNVTALVVNGVSGGSPTASSGVCERLHYDPYGGFVVLNGGTDYQEPSAGDFSVDGDGMSDVYNERLFCGYQADWEFNIQGHGFYYPRHRYYHAPLGRWITRDPNNRDLPGGGYQDGMNLYEYVGSRPTTGADPFGLAQIKITYVPHKDKGPKITETTFEALGSKDGYLTAGLYEEHVNRISFGVAKRAARKETAKNKEWKDWAGCFCLIVTGVEWEDEISIPSRDQWPKHTVADWKEVAKKIRSMSLADFYSQGLFIDYDQTLAHEKQHSAQSRAVAADAMKRLAETWNKPATEWPHHLLYVAPDLSEPSRCRATKDAAQELAKVYSAIDWKQIRTGDTKVTMKYYDSVEEASGDARAYFILDNLRSGLVGSINDAKNKKYKHLEAKDSKGRTIKGVDIDAAKVGRKALIEKWTALAKKAKT
jgi:RHS repeat-associated protein